MTVAENGINGLEEVEVDENLRAPDLHLDWTDLKIEIKVYGKDIEEEEFVELYPRPSSNLLSSTCIQERKEERRAVSRAGSRIGYTLTELLEGNQEINSRKPDLPDDDDDDDYSEEAGGGGDNKVKKEDPDADDNDPTSMKKLKELPNGQKQCHICDKVFTDNSRIKRHLLSHSGKKPFSCHLCGWGFYQKCNMDRHMASHTEEGKGEPCPHCNNWFTTKSVLSLHMRDAHNDRLLTKKEVEVTMNRMRRQIEEQKKQTEREEHIARIKQLQARKLQQVQEQRQKIALAHKQRLIQFQQHHKKQQQQQKQQEQKLKQLQQQQQEQQQQMQEQQQQMQEQQQQMQQQQFPGMFGTVEAPFTFQAHNLFPNQEELNRQITRMANLTCKLCGKTFVKKTNLKHHMMLHRGEKPWKCSICEWRFVQKCNLKKHLESHVTGAFLCPVCDVRFSSKASCSTHLFRAHKDAMPSVQVQELEEAEVPAPQTSSPGKSMNNWWQQLDLPSSSSTSPSKPAASSASPVSSISNLQAALSMPVKKKTTPPPVAPRVDRPIAPRVTQPMTCNKCGKMFLTQQHLDKHMMVHNAGVKPYSCAVCGARFHLLHNMKRHIHTHEEHGDIEAGTADGLIQAAAVDAAHAQSVPAACQPKPNTPSLTGVTKDSKGNLKCGVCMKWFTSAAALGVHMQLHDTAKPFTCSICGWRFKQHQNLKRHMHHHTGIKPFTCDFCEKGYTDAYSLKVHISKVHPDVASSLPSMQLTPKPTVQKGDEASFKNMLNEMQREKEAAVEAYQAQFNNTQNDKSTEEDGEDSLVLEPDINMFTPEEDMVVEDESVDLQDESVEKEDNSVVIEEDKEKDKEDNPDDDDVSQEIRDILEMDEDEDEAVEEIPVDDVPVTVDDVALQLSEPLEASTPKVLKKKEVEGTGKDLQADTIENIVAEDNTDDSAKEDQVIDEDLAAGDDEDEDLDGEGNDDHGVTENLDEETSAVPDKAMVVTKEATASNDLDEDLVAGDEEDEDLGMIDDADHCIEDDHHAIDDHDHGDDGIDLDDEDLVAGDDEDENFQSSILEPVTARSSVEDCLPIITSVSSAPEEEED